MVTNRRPPNDVKMKEEREKSVNKAVNREELFIKSREIEFFQDEDMIIGYCADTGTTFCFNKTSYVVYDHCDKKNLQQIVVAVMDAYSIDAQDCEIVKKDVIDVLEQFVECHIVERIYDTQDSY